MVLNSSPGIYSSSENQLTDFVSDHMKLIKNLFKIETKKTPPILHPDPSSHKTLEFSSYVKLISVEFNITLLGQGHIEGFKVCCNCNHYNARFMLINHEKC